MPKPLQQISNTPLTPGRHVRQLKSELEKKDSENEDLKNQLADLTKALGSLQIVKEKTMNLENPVEMKDNKKKGKKTTDEKAPAPAMTAYRYFCEDVKVNNLMEIDDDTNMRQLWKECQGDARKKYVDMAVEDKKRFEKEDVVYQKMVSEKEKEQKALEMYYDKQKQDLAMEFYEAHMQATNLLNEKKNKKKTKDPDAPKGAMSSYLFFCQEKRDSITKQNSEKGPAEIMKILAEEWNKLQKGKGGKKGTKKYDDLAAKDKIRYEKEKEKYDAVKAERQQEIDQEHEMKLQKDKEEAFKLMKELQKEETVSSPENIESDKASAPNQKNTKKKKDPNAPKHPMSGYMYFCKEKREEITKKNPGKSPTEITKVLGEEWKKLEKGKSGKKGTKKYDDMAAKDKIRYSTEMEAYNAKQLKPNKDEAVEMLKKAMEMMKEVEN